MVRADLRIAGLVRLTVKAAPSAVRPVIRAFVSRALCTAFVRLSVIPWFGTSGRLSFRGPLVLITWAAHVG
jgi:hypothetical protein